MSCSGCIGKYFHDDTLRATATVSYGNCQCSSGYIFPMLLCVREQPASDGPPAFVGIMRALSTTDNHIVMTADYVITAASQASLTVLNVEPAALAAGDAKMSNWVDEWDVSNTRKKSDEMQRHSTLFML
jgi:hypothetical protein